MDRQSPAWALYQESLSAFGSDEVVVVAVPADAPFSTAALETVRDLSGRFEKIPGVARVDSLATVPLIDADPSGALSLEPSIGHSVPSTEPERGRLAVQVSQDRLAKRSLVSVDGRTFALNLSLEGPPSGFDRVVAAIRDEVAASGPAWVSGVPVFRTEANRRTRSEILLLAPFTAILMAGFLFAVFRSPVAVIVPTLASSLGSWMTLGVIGFVGRPVNASSMILPSVLLALGCAYVMHVLCAAVGAGDRRSLSRAARAVATPIALSGATTALGFLAIGTVRIEAAQELGAFGGVGVLVVLFAALTIAPAALALWPLPRRPGVVHEWIDSGLRGWVVSLVSKRAWVLLAVWAALLCGFGIGLVQTTVSTDLTRWFPGSSEVRQSYEEIKSRLAGISPMNVVIQAADGDSVARPATIRAVADLASFLEKDEAVGRALSVADPLTQLHQGFTADLSAGLPRSASAIEQYLLLLESVEQLSDLITADRSAANILLRVNDNASDRLVAIGKRAEDWWLENGPTGTRAYSTGIMFEFGRAEEAIAYGQLQGLGLALVAISAVLLVVLRAPRTALTAIVPNLVPLIVVFGLMGFLGVPLDVGNIVLGSLALGIAVDDTIHFLARYEELEKEGVGVREVLDGTLSRILRPVVYTTIAIGLGFSVLAISGFTVVRNLGLVTTAMVMLCLLADLLLLPVLLEPNRARKLD